MCHPQGERIWIMALWTGQAAGARTGSATAWTPAPRFSPSSPEPSPYDESEMHDSFHQLIQEQSLWAAEEGLELQQLGSGASGEPAWPRPRWWDSVGRALTPSTSQDVPPGGLQAWDGNGWGRSLAPCLQDLQASLSALQAVTSRPSWGPRGPWPTARPRSESWPACPVAPLVSGTLCPQPWR